MKTISKLDLVTKLLSKIYDDKVLMNILPKVLCKSFSNGIFDDRKNLYISEILEKHLVGCVDVIHKDIIIYWLVSGHGDTFTLYICSLVNNNIIFIKFEDDVVQTRVDYTKYSDPKREFFDRLDIAKVGGCTNSHIISIL